MIKKENLNHKKAITVLSGGLDSAVATAVYAKEYDIHAITFDYGQKAAKKEIQVSKEICKALNIKHTVMDLKWLGQISNSALTTDKPIPEIENNKLDDTKTCTNTADKVWVPGRNIVFTSIATSFAEAENAEIIIVGWDKEEAATFPDNSKEFLEKYNQMLKEGSPQNITVKAPAIDLNKKEIVQLGQKYNAPMNLSYSCYKGNNKHCGVCESCMRRKRAFKEAQISDPTDYEQ
jgi:7-cyano-7-deazaguanine synthase